MKLFQVILIGLILVFGSAAVTMGATNWKMGKTVFQEQCKGCHVEGAEGGKITPSSKTRSQWRRFFKSENHREKLHELSEEEMKSLRLFLDRSAADADQAETCG